MTMQHLTQSIILHIFVSLASFYLNIDPYLPLTGTLKDDGASKSSQRHQESCVKASHHGVLPHKSNLRDFGLQYGLTPAGARFQWMEECCYFGKMNAADPMWR